MVFDVARKDCFLVGLGIENNILFTCSDNIGVTDDPAHIVFDRYLGTGNFIGAMTSLIMLIR